MKKTGDLKSLLKLMSCSRILYKMSFWKIALTSCLEIWWKILLPIELKKRAMKTSTGQLENLWIDQHTRRIHLLLQKWNKSLESLVKIAETRLGRPNFIFSVISILSGGWQRWRSIMRILETWLDFTRNTICLKTGLSSCILVLIAQRMAS